MGNPKFSVGEIVKVWHDVHSQFNCKQTIITDRIFLPKGKLIWSHEITRDHFAYRTSNSGTMWVPEILIHPIPKEPENGIDALEYIKGLVGVEA